MNPWKQVKKMGARNSITPRRMAITIKQISKTLAISPNVEYIHPDNKLTTEKIFQLNIERKTLCFFIEGKTRHQKNITISEIKYPRNCNTCHKLRIHPEYQVGNLHRCISCKNHINS